MLLINPQKTLQTVEKRETIKSWMDEDDHLEDIQISPDGESVAALFVNQEGETTLCVNGDTWEHGFARLWYPRFSPDNRLTALAWDEEAWTLIVDDQVWNNRFDYAWNTGFSKDGEHIMIVFQKDGSYGLCLDDVPWKTVFPGIGHATISSDGSKTAASVQMEKISEGDIFTFQKGVFSTAIDGNVWQERFMNIWDPTFSSDGNKTACTVRLNLNDYSVAVDGETWPRNFQCVWKPVFQPGTSDVVAPVKTNQSWTLAKNGDLIWKNRFNQLLHPEFNFDGSKLSAIVAPSFGSWSIAVNDKVWKLDRFDSISWLTYSPDGQRLAAVGMKNGKYTLIYDGKSLNRFCERVWAPVFSPDSRHIATRIETNGRYSVIVDGHIWDKVYDKIWDPVFDSDSKTLLIRALDGCEYLKIRVPLSHF